MDPRHEYVRLVTRRWFLSAGGSGLGLAALWTLLGDDVVQAAAQAGAAGQTGAAAFGGLPGLPHFAPKAKRVIYLFMAGAPSHIDLFDYKPKLVDSAGKDLPDSVRGTQRLTGFTRSQNSLPVIPSAFKFAQHGQSGAWLSELLPYTAKVADDLCFIKSMNTEQINHDPAVMYLLTGFQLPGRPSLGAWVSYALGSENRNLPALIAMVTTGKGTNGAPAFDRHWGNGFLPAKYQGVKFGSGTDPVLYLSDPEGFERADERKFLDELAALNNVTLKESGDPEIAARIEQYEMAARMQTAVPDLMDLSKEPESTFELYGPESKKPGAFARNCLLARRMAERGVRFIQVAHMGWDQHGNLPIQLAGQAKDVDQGAAALIQDLKQRGMLEDTLVIFGGEFGRTVYGQFGNTGAKEDASTYGRDHHPRCFTIWMAGGGIKPGITYGETDDFSYNIVRDPVSIHDWQATILNRLGIDHTRLTYRHMGRDFRLTDVEGQVVKGIVT
jgi:hypothetical protein